MKMYEFVKDKGMTEHSIDHDYCITELIFTCPTCKRTINQANYRNNYFWRKAVIEHMKFQHNVTIEDEHY